MKLLVKGGVVLDPVRSIQREVDVLVVGDRIVACGEGLVVEDALVVDVSGKYVVPGLVDMHVHLREPGYEHKETIASGTRAAARGGFTSVVCMPNTDPVADNPAVISYIISSAARTGVVNVFPVGAITVGIAGERLSEMASMKKAGAVAVSDDGKPVKNAAVMMRAMQYASMAGLPVISHCEDPDLSGAGSAHEGWVSTFLGLKGIPASAEEVMVAREIILAEETGCSVHIAHVSTAGSVRLVREAKARGVRVTAEATPHHFTLTDEALTDYNTNAKVNPPLRTGYDVDAVRMGLADGTIDVIATDHAPHAAEEKNVEYDRAPFGIAGLETAVGLVWSELVATGVLTPLDAVAKMTINPSRILGLDKGTLSIGASADITVIDPELEEVVDPLKFVGNGRNTPFTGRRLKGLPVVTIVAGRVVYKKKCKSTY